MTIACLSSREVDQGKYAPSNQVRKETKALLEASLFKRLPRSLAETEGVLLTQKNTFFHVEQLADGGAVQETDWESDASPTQSGSSGRRDSGVRAPRKKTECNIIYLASRRLSTSSSALRCRSCPPTTPGTPVSIPEGSLSPSIPSNPISAGACAPTLYTFAPASPTPFVQPLPLMSLLSNEIPATLESAITAIPSSGEKTTVMLRNIPYHEGQLGVLRLLESRGFLGKFDFFYAPLDFASGNNLGYAFLNFRSIAAVNEFIGDIDGLRVPQEGWSAKELRVCWARVQGVGANVEHYRNSPVNEMPVQFRPMLFDVDGGQLTFPRPDRSSPPRPVGARKAEYRSFALSRPATGSATRRNSALLR